MYNDDLIRMFEEITRYHLGIETLKAQNSDTLDFHEVSVGGLFYALNAAFRLGLEHTGRVVDELCAACFEENTFVHDCATEGYPAKCQVCGEAMMLCDACQHADDAQTCDFRWTDRENGRGTCRRRNYK